MVTKILTGHKTIQNTWRPEYFYLRKKDLKYQFQTYACPRYSDTATVERRFKVMYVH